MFQEDFSVRLLKTLVINRMAVVERGEKFRGGAGVSNLVILVSGPLP